MAQAEKQNYFLEDLVEPVNRYLHNPIAARLVKGLVKTPVTPDQVTYTSILFGLSSAYAFSRGTVMALGGLLLEITLILDCADGQLARAKGCASEWGRFLDGIAGYISYLAVVIGLLVGLGEPYGALMAIAVFTILRAITYDYCKQNLTSWIRDGTNEGERDLRATFDRVRSEGSPVSKIYFYYLQLQQLIFRGRWRSLKQFSSAQKIGSGESLWNEEKRHRAHQNLVPLMAVWKWNGPDLPLFLFFVFSLLGVLKASLAPIAWIMGAQFFLTLMLHHYHIRHEDLA